MQVLLAAMIRDSLPKKSKSHTHLIRSLKYPGPICPSFPRPTQRKDWKEPKLRKCRNASTFFLLTPSLFPFLFLFPIPNLHQYVSAYAHMPINSLILKREHFRRWTTMFFTSKFSTAQRFLITFLTMPTPMPRQNQDPIISSRFPTQRSLIPKDQT